jgi:hypothetical protein
MEKDDTVSLEACNATVVQSLFAAVLRSDKQNIVSQYMKPMEYFKSEEHGQRAHALVVDQGVRFYCLLAFDSHTVARKWLLLLSSSRVVKYENNVWIRTHFDCITVLTLSHRDPCIVLVLLAKRQRYGELLKCSKALVTARGVQFLSKKENSRFHEFFRSVQGSLSLSQRMRPKSIKVVDFDGVEALSQAVGGLLECD